MKGKNPGNSKTTTDKKLKRKPLKEAKDGNNKNIILEQKKYLIKNTYNTNL